MPSTEVLIVGGGLAGLCCALHLKKQGVSAQILEASQTLGGRIQTDLVEGFRLDRGFQVLLTAYPEAEKLLDYTQLQLGRFAPGALIRYRGKFERLVDPWRRPQHAFSTALSPVATFVDKLRLAKLRAQVCRGKLTDIYERVEETTIAALHSHGFSDRIIESFFRPFLGGVFLERELQTSSRKFEFVFRMFSIGDAALPANGMNAIAAQIACQLPQRCKRVGATVEKVTPECVHLVNGEELTAPNIVLAVESPMASKLVGESADSSAHAATCLYFAADEPPITEPILVLNGDEKGPINNLCVPSQVVPSYAPANRSLISVTVLNDPNQEQPSGLNDGVLEQLRAWFGPVVDRWKHLRTYNIPYALPVQSPPALALVEKPAVRADGLFVSGDYLDTASIQGAMVSGRRAAEAIVSRMSAG